LGGRNRDQGPMENHKLLSLKSIYKNQKKTHKDLFLKSNYPNQLKIQNPERIKLNILKF
jgi:hypothetical protein